MDAIVKIINEAIEEKLHLIDFLRAENTRLTKVNVEQINRIEALEARIKELEGDYNNNDERDDF
jgi:hypothetical protein